MIYEYALEPDLVVAWCKNREHCIHYPKEFGVGTPRIMAEFPKFKKWHKQLKIAAADADNTNELPRITALFTQLMDRLVRREGFEYDGNLTWLENAESENARLGFHAILAVDNPRRHAKVLPIGAVETSPLWQVEKQVYCPRRPVDMAQLVSTTLANCSEIHFIDPHFGPEITRFRRPLEAFLDIIAKMRSSRPIIEKIVVHTSDKADFNFFKKACNEELLERIPIGIRLILQRWKVRKGGELLHHRYILTDIGGLKFDPGLDDGQEGQTVEVILLEKKSYEKQWNDYITKPAFDRSEDPIEIIGTKR